MRILLTGASGFVGSHFIANYSQRYEIVGNVGKRSAPPQVKSYAVDLADSVSLSEFVRAIKPQVVIHAAALSRVLECEANPDMARIVNIRSSQTLASLCEEIGAKLIYFSSDQVFDGTQGLYRESDAPHPINIYGETKLAAEQAVLDAAERNVVIRSNSIVGRTRGWGQSFTDIILSAFGSGQAFRAFYDQYRSPIHISHMLRVVETCIEADVRGVLHAGGRSRLNRVEICEILSTLFDRPLEIEPTSYKSHELWQIMPADTSYTLERAGDLCPQISTEPLTELLYADYHSFLIQ